MFINPSILTLILSLLSLTTSQPTSSDSCIIYNADASVCTTCLQGLYLQYFFCIPCNPLCSCNSSANYCSACLNVTIKHRTYMSFPSGEICRLCNQTLPYCIQCSNNGLTCHRCAMGKYLLTDGMCSNTTCAFNCQFCLNQTACRECLPGYYLNITGQCIESDCTSNCSVCEDATSCKICNIQYIAINGTCQPCIQFCAICINTTLCQVCLPSYIPVNGTCQSTGLSNCIQYNGGVASPTCLVCQPGYYNAQGSCTQCSGCLLCTQAFLCQTPCLQGFVKFNYACIQFQLELCNSIFVFLTVVMLVFFV